MVTGNAISIREYKVSDAPELLRLLLLLHSGYFSTNASKEIQELREERDITKSYQDYINQITDGHSQWKIILAVDAEKKVIGFIIGSITEDSALIKSKMGILEDWFVEDEHREKGIGMKLYNELEEWFGVNGCHQVLSDTWKGNEQGIKAHRQMGFFMSGIMFSKKLK